MTSTPAAMLLAASSVVVSSENATAVSALPVKISARLRDRVSTVAQVPWRSSAENKSPPTIPVNTGNAHNPANPSTTSDTAKPDSLAARPNNVSVGRLLCTRIEIAKMNGAATQIASSTCALTCASSFEHSTLITVNTPATLMQGSVTAILGLRRQQQRTQQAQCPGGHP